MANGSSETNDHEEMGGLVGEGQQRREMGEIEMEIDKRGGCLCRRREEQLQHGCSGLGPEKCCPATVVRLPHSCLPGGSSHSHPM